MSEKTLSMEMGNLVCRFGQEKVLLDMLEEVVIPSFQDEKLVRGYDKTRYFFHQVDVVSLAEKESEPVLGIVGRLIKDTTLEREQIFEAGKGLVHDSESMRSSPSSLFLLILNNHRLVYVKETKDAPSKESFKSTLLSFLRNKHKEFIDSEYDRLNGLREDGDGSRVVTKKDLQELYPRPTLKLTSLTSEDSIEDFVNKYSVLRAVEISLSDRNDENDNDPFFEELQKRKDAIGSVNSVVKHNNPQGLNKNEVISEVSEATEQGNQSVKLVGFDSNGDILRGNNDNFQLRKPIENLSSSPLEAAVDLFDSFIGLVEDGLVKVPEPSRKTKEIIRSFFERFF